MALRLSAKLARVFPASVRTRGLSLYDRHAVKIIEGSPRRVEAMVSEGRLYEAELDWDGLELNLSCTCRHFETDGPCQHLWAVVLAAEGRGFLSAVPASPIINDDPVDMDDEFDDDFALPLFPKAPERPPLPAPPKPPAWKTRIERVGPERPEASGAQWPDKREILYLVDQAACVASGSVVLGLYTRDRKLNGTFSRMAQLKLQRGKTDSLPNAGDRAILAQLLGGSQYYGYGSYGDVQYGPVPSSYSIRWPLSATVIPMVARTGRLFLRANAGSEELVPLAWDDDGPWQFGLLLREGRTAPILVGGKPKGGNEAAWLVEGVLRRDDRSLPLSEANLVLRGGLLFAGGKVAPLAEDTNFDWLMHLRTGGSIPAPPEDRDALLATLLCAPGLPPVEVPQELQYEEVTVRPVPGLRLRPGIRRNGADMIAGQLSFIYGDRVVPSAESSSGFFDASSRCLIRRDTAAERAAGGLLAEHGMRFRPADWQFEETCWEMPAPKLPRLIRALLAEGWHIDADGKVFRRPGESRLELSSGVDWFELHGEVEYGEGETGRTTVKLPELLAALRRGEEMVELSDGTYGVLPEEWLKRIGVLAGMGTPDDGHIRFRRSQAGLLDALLATRPEVRFDESFAAARDEIRRFQGIEAAAQPEGFVGQLRDYQREGVGWMAFLRRFSFGGCLADDMGVGKTAQVLAMLESRRNMRDTGKLSGPSLVVAPRSLIFNWKQEAARFTPGLRVLDHTGLGRAGNDFSGYDLILTTYGTLRRDAVRMKDVRFDYIVLDEAQAVKNASTESAKAVRLLEGDHRLALSGTPVENHLGELWSLFDFLNPGMLGSASVFQATSGISRTESGADEATRQLLSHALRPFILRRTKEQVARELPEKMEQTLYCELEPQQRKLYNELRQHYRDSLLQKIQTQGMAKSKIMVLEALLRLRQAACHPGLIDPKRVGESSAKLEALEEQLREVIESGHKALVFSQFTSLLKIVRDRLDREKVVYEYLDGKTTNRQAHVERFQNDPKCPLFLISLKAGGLGLNLTAADYVFLLDPWWNPAVEAQAVDRAHRIGQTRQVFAYRLIARDTVEEKVLELQKSKRDLAAAIIGQDNALIRDLKREDLDLLLS